MRTRSALWWLGSNAFKCLQSKVDWPVVSETSEPSSLTRQSTHDFNDWPFLFVQRHETLVQLFTLEMMVEQLFLHCIVTAVNAWLNESLEILLTLSGITSGSMISALAVKELNAWRGERCSRLVAETVIKGQSGTRPAHLGKLACRNEGNGSQKEGAHYGWLVLEGTKRRKDRKVLVPEREAWG